MSLSKFCRVCFVLSGDLEGLTREKGSMGYKLRRCVPEIDIYKIRGPAICKKCTAMVQVAYDLRETCLNNEHRLRNCRSLPPEPNTSFNDRAAYNYFNLESVMDSTASLDERGAANTSGTEVNPDASSLMPPPLDSGHRVEIGTDNNPNILTKLTLNVVEELKYTCDECNEHFPTCESLNFHVLTHRSEVEEIFECARCKKKFSSESVLRRHVRRCEKSKGKEKARVQSGQQQNANNSQQLHQQTTQAADEESRGKNGQPALKSNNCSKSFTNRKYLVRHYRVCNRKMPSLREEEIYAAYVFCTHCLIVFTSTDEQLDDMQGNVECDTCHRRFPVESGIPIHFRCKLYGSAISGKEIIKRIFYKCSLCEKLLYQISYLPHHAVDCLRNKICIENQQQSQADDQTDTNSEPRPSASVDRAIEEPKPKTSSASDGRRVELKKLYDIKHKPNLLKLIGKCQTSFKDIMAKQREIAECTSHGILVSVPALAAQSGEKATAGGNSATELDKDLCEDENVKICIVKVCECQNRTDNQPKATAKQADEVAEATGNNGTLSLEEQEKETVDEQQEQTEADDNLIDLLKASKEQATEFADGTGKNDMLFLEEQEKEVVDSVSTPAYAVLKPINRLCTEENMISTGCGETKVPEHQKQTEADDLTGQPKAHTEQTSELADLAGRNSMLTLKEQERVAANPESTSVNALLKRINCLWRKENMFIGSGSDEKEACEHQKQTEADDNLTGEPKASMQQATELADGAGKNETEKEADDTLSSPANIEFKSVNGFCKKENTFIHPGSDETDVWEHQKQTESDGNLFGQPKAFMEQATELADDVGKNEMEKEENTIIHTDSEEVELCEHQEQTEANDNFIDHPKATTERTIELDDDAGKNVTLSLEEQKKEAVCMVSPIANIEFKFVNGLYKEEIIITSTGSGKTELCKLKQTEADDNSIDQANVSTEQVTDFADDAGENATLLLKEQEEEAVGTVSPPASSEFTGVIGSRKEENIIRTGSEETCKRQKQADDNSIDQPKASTEQVTELAEDAGKNRILSPKEQEEEAVATVSPPKNSVLKGVDGFCKEKNMTIRAGSDEVEVCELQKQTEADDNSIDQPKATAEQMTELADGAAENGAVLVEANAKVNSLAGNEFEESVNLSEEDTN